MYHSDTRDRESCNVIDNNPKNNQIADRIINMTAITTEVGKENERKICKELTDTIVSLSSSALALKEVSNIVRIIKSPPRSRDKDNDNQGVQSKSLFPVVSKAAEVKTAEANTTEFSFSKNEKRQMIFDQIIVLDQSLKHLEEKVEILKEIIHEENASLDDLEAYEVDHLQLIQNQMIAFMIQQQQPNTRTRETKKHDPYSNEIEDRDQNCDSSNVDYPNNTINISNSSDQKKDTVGNSLSSFPSDEES